MQLKQVMLVAHNDHIGFYLFIKAYFFVGGGQSITFIN